MREKKNGRDAAALLSQSIVDRTAPEVLESMRLLLQLKYPIKNRSALKDQTSRFRSAPENIVSRYILEIFTGKDYPLRSARQAMDLFSGNVAFHNTPLPIPLPIPWPLPRTEESLIIRDWALCVANGEDAYQRCLRDAGENEAAQGNCDLRRRISAGVCTVARNRKLLELLRRRFPGIVPPLPWPWPR